MGAQRWLAEAVMEYFLVDEDDAYRLAVIIEDVQLGDDIMDAVFWLKDKGDLTLALEELRNVHERLGDKIANLDVAFSGLKRRKAPR